MTNIQRKLQGYFWGAAMIAVAAGAPAFGQAAGQATATTSGADAQGALGEIVVTAQRRPEGSQRVPIAVSAVGADVLQSRGLNSVESLNSVVPSLNVVNSSVSTNIYLRGVGASSVTAGQEGDVAIFVDGVYYPAVFSNILSFNNIDHVEVLRGPQGTLFGRNATGGVIQVVTRRPSQTPTADIKMAYGSYNTISADAYVSGPLAPRLTASLAAQDSYQKDGWGHNLFNGAEVNRDKSTSVRAAVEWAPDDSTRISVNGNYFHRDTDIGGANQVLPGIPVLPATYGSQVFNGNIYDSYNNFPTNFRVEQFDGSLHAQHDLSFAKLVNILAYQDVTGNALIAGGPGTAISQVRIHLRTRATTEELQFQSLDSSTIKWVAGFYYFNSPSSVSPLKVVITPVPNNPNFALTVSTVYSYLKTVSYSGFADVTVPIFGPATRLTGGVRYTKDDKTINGTVNGKPTAQAKNWGQATFRVSLAHDFLPHVMGYATVSTGFKSGVFSASGPASPPVDPEKLTDYEIGLKTRAFNGHLELNLSGFYYDYKNLQVLKIVNNVGTLQNAAQAKIYGLEVEGRAALTKALSLHGSVGLQHSEFVSFPNALGYIRLASGLDASAPAGCGVAPAPQCGIDATGNQLPRAPKFTGAFGASYDVEVGSVDALLAADLYHNSGFPWDADNRLKQRAYNLVDASLTLKQREGPLSVQFAVRNLFAERYYSYVIANTNAPDVGSPGAPRTLNVSLRAKF